MLGIDAERTPGFKLFLAIVVAGALTIRSSPSTCSTSTANAAARGDELHHVRLGRRAGLAGPVLVIPYRTSASETVSQNGQKHHPHEPGNFGELTLAPEAAQLSTELLAEVRKRSILEAVIYDARNVGEARSAFPADLARIGVDPSQMDLSRAELRSASATRAGSARIPE